MAVSVVAIVEIVILILVLLAVAILIWWFIRRRRQGRADGGGKAGIAERVMGKLKGKGARGGHEAEMGDVDTGINIIILNLVVIVQDR